MSDKKIMGEVVFSGDMNPNPDGATAALQRAGFDIVRMPDHFLQRMYCLGDEFLEATKVGDADEIWKEIDELVGRFGGDCQACGPVDEHELPFAFMYEAN